MYGTILSAFLLLQQVNSYCYAPTFLNTRVQYCYDEHLNCDIETIDGCAEPPTVPAEIVTISSDSKIAALNPGAIQNLNKLTKINFNDRGIQRLSPQCFSNLPYLRAINLAKNEIRRIPERVFTFTTTRVIILDSNQISDIQPDAFSKMRNLETISLYGNQLRTIDKGWFRGSNNVKQLNLKNNKITAIPEDAFRDFTSLEVLDVSFNQISEINAVLFAGQSFDYINLMHNQISKITSPEMPYAFAVKEVYLGMNHIRYFTMEFQQAIRAEKMQIFPNPLSYPCLRHFERWAHFKQVQIVDITKDPYIKWEDNLPFCVMPNLIEDKDLCDFDKADQDKEGLKMYLDVVDYSKIVTDYAKVHQLYGNI